MKAKAVLPKKIELPKLSLDFGCGPNPTLGYDGVDSIDFDGKVKHVVDLRITPFPFEDESTEKSKASHFIEHLTASERVKFMNELYRILIPGGTFEMVVPHWASNRAYGDPTHQWPPISEMWFYYLKEDWRTTQAPHTDIKYNKDGFSCNFEATWGYSLRGDLLTRNQDYQQNAIANYKEACQDTIAKLVKV
jgi:SAM-dependent methyltransferase